MHTFHIIVEFDAWNSNETRVCGTERAGRLIERRSDSRLEHMNLCYDSTGLKSCTQYSAKDKTRCIILYTLLAIQPVFGETHWQQSCSSPAMTERKMKPASSSHPTDSRWRPRCLILRNFRKTDIAEKVDMLIHGRKDCCQD